MIGDDIISDVNGATDCRVSEVDQIYDNCDTNDTDEDDDEEVEEFCKSRFSKITLLSSTVKPLLSGHVRTKGVRN